MKKVLSWILTALLVVLLPLVGLQLAVDRGLRKSKLPLYSTWNDIYNGRINANVAIVGSSRAYWIVDPHILDSALGINSYNFGHDGWPFSFQDFRFRRYLEHNPKPRYVIHTVDLDMFSRRKDLFTPEEYLPYLDQAAVIQFTKDYAGSFSVPERFLPMFKYNNKFELIQEGILSGFGRGKKSKIYKGYLPKDEPWKSANLDYIRAQFPNGVPDTMDDKVKQQFLDYIQYCQSNDIKLIFEFAPYYYEGYAYHSNRDAIRDTIRAIAARFQIPYLDYASDSLMYHREYFYNSTHLNKTGAQIFTVKLAGDLINVIKL